MISLRSYQSSCVQGVRRSYESGKRAPLLVAPTGAGKTVMFSHMAQICSDKEQQALIMAHRKELITQCGNKLMENGVDFGYINAKFTPDYSRNVQVGTIQSIKPRMTKISFDPKLIIIDEAHRATAKTYRDILNHYPKARILGVTATPIRADGTALSDIFDDMVMGPSIKELIDGGYLVPPRTFPPATVIDVSKVRVLASGDYDLKQLEEIVDRDVITGDAVEQYRKICDGVPAVCFCVSIKHAMHVAEQFRAAGYKWEHLDGTMGDAERDDILHRLATGQLNGVTSVDLITEGFDAPMLECAIMLRPTKSLGLYLQMAGRVLRIFPGKKCAYILDHVGLMVRHGRVEADRVWTLDGSEATPPILPKGEGKEKAPKMKICPVCWNVSELKAKECFKCGFFFTVRSREVDTVDGDLVELPADPGDMVIDADGSGLLEQLKVLGHSRGYREGWAFDIYKEWMINKPVG